MHGLIASEKVALLYREHALYLNYKRLSSPADIQNYCEIQAVVFAAVAILYELCVDIFMFLISVEGHSDKCVLSWRL